MSFRRFAVKSPNTRRPAAWTSNACDLLEKRQLLSAGDIDVAPFEIGAAPVAEASAAADGPTARIVNGDPTTEFPAVGFVGPLGCTGTLISPTHVLTAAHCVVANGTQLGDREGEFVLAGRTYNSSKITVHPQYDDFNFGAGYDLAIIELQEPVLGVTPEKILRTAPQVGQILTLVGFGEGGTSTGGFDPDDAGKQVGQTELERVLPLHIEWTFDSHTEANTAPGDSGGPSFVTIGGERFIAGITSGGSGDAHTLGDDSFNTRIDVFADWIDGIVGSGGDGGGDPGSRLEFTQEADIAITRDSVRTYSSKLDVQGVQGNITDLNVTIDLYHNRTSDIGMTLVSPAGTSIALVRRVGERGRHFEATVLDDEAGTSINAGDAPFRGTFQPHRPLSKVDGEDPNGEWRLFVRDNATGARGELREWTLEFETDQGTAPPPAGSFVTTTPVAISSSGTPTVTSPLDVSGLTGTVTDINVLLDIEHTFASDLTVTLVAPTGRRLELFRGVGGSSDDFTDTVLDGEATGQLVDAASPRTGRFRPAGDLTKLNGIDPNGQWLLEVADGFDVDGGQIVSWGLEVATTDDGGGPVDPGDTSFTTETPVNISPDVVATVNSSLAVSGVTGDVTDVNVRLDIDHTYAEDLRVALIGPTGLRVLLFREIGGSADNFRGTILDDQASTAISSASAPFAGSFRPFRTLSQFNGLDPNGTWRLEVRDLAELDGGVIKSWGLDFTTTTSANSRSASTDDEDLPAATDKYFEGRLG